MSLQIEPGSLSDLHEMERLYDEVNDALSKGINYPGWIKGVYPAREDAETAIAAGTLFVAKKEGRIVGSVILNSEKESGYDGVIWGCEYDYDRIFVIHTLAVHPDHLKAGVGRELMKFAEVYGKRKGIKAIRLDVFEKNCPAIRLYESCGYQYKGTVDLGYGGYGLDLFKLYEKLL